jgi:hypothetical protein
LSRTSKTSEPSDSKAAMRMQSPALGEPCLIALATASLIASLTW